MTLSQKKGVFFLKKKITASFQPKILNLVSYSSAYIAGDIIPNITAKQSGSINAEKIF